MAFGNASEIRTAFIAEATAGTTPATPTFQTARFTSGGMRSNKTVVTSDERRADRNVPDEILTGLGASGSYDFELAYGALDDIIAAALCGAWSTNILKNGILQPSFTFEETIELGATDSFHRFLGTEVNTLNLSVTAKEKVTGSIGLMALQETPATAIITGATYTAANAEPISTASANVANLTVGALNPQPKVRSLSFEVNNGLRERPVVGSPYTSGFGRGRCEVTGTMEAYFETQALYAAVLAHETAAMSFTVGNATAKKYTIAFPRIRLGDGETTKGGNDDDIMVTVPFRAIYDATEACSIKITRAVA